MLKILEEIFMGNERKIEQLKLGDILNNRELCSIFKCANQGGMRRSLKTKTLVIISNHDSPLYLDRWENQILHYTGMGKKGDQNLEHFQNRTLAESATNGVSVHLFEVKIKQEYSYIGQVKLVKPPYFENQADENGDSRQVFVFPLKIIDI